MILNNIKMKDLIVHVGIHQWLYVQLTKAKCLSTSARWMTAHTKLPMSPTRSHPNFWRFTTMFTPHINTNSQLFDKSLPKSTDQKSPKVALRKHGELSTHDGSCLKMEPILRLGKRTGSCFSVAMKTSETTYYAATQQFWTAQRNYYCKQWRN